MAYVLEWTGQHAGCAYTNHSDLTFFNDQVRRCMNNFKQSSRTDHKHFFGHEMMIVVVALSLVIFHVKIFYRDK